MRTRTVRTCNAAISRFLDTLKSPSTGERWCRWHRTNCVCAHHLRHLKRDRKDYAGAEREYKLAIEPNRNMRGSSATSGFQLFFCVNGQRRSGVRAQADRGAPQHFRCVRFNHGFGIIPCARATLAPGREFQTGDRDRLERSSCRRIQSQLALAEKTLQPSGSPSYSEPTVYKLRVDRCSPPPGGGWGVDGTDAPLQRRLRNGSALCVV